MNRIIIIIIIGISTGLWAGPNMAIATEPAATTIDFNRDVRPIFNQHCVACHGGVKQAGDLSFVYQDSVLALVDPGSWEDSYLLERVLLAEDEEEHMPPIDHGRALNDREIGILKRWVESGAEWGKHWAYAQPKRSSIEPTPQAGNWSRTAIDPFVFAQLESVGLKPQDEATPLRWLRRASLDLIGLPPTQVQIKTFLDAVATRGESAYKSEVARLLSSPSFGERWASVWLDTIRYADSKGLGIDGRRTIWQYRDWVIRAFNQDMPYDLFTTRQLAGDLMADNTLDDILATACHRTTQTNEEGGTDDETFRTEAVMDRVNTTWQAWQGLSFGCVQCHSHPYDPIEHKEYYQFLAFFNNTADSDLGNDLPTLAVPVDRDDYQVAFDLDQKIAQRWRTEWELARNLISVPSNWSPVTEISAKTNNNTKVVTRLSEGVEEYTTTGTVQTKTTIELECQVDDSIKQITAIQFTGLPKDEEKALVDSEWGFNVSHLSVDVLTEDGQTTPVTFQQVISDELDPMLDPNDSLNAKTSRGFGPYSRIHRRRTAAFLVNPPAPIGPSDKLKIKVAFNGVELGAFPQIAHRGRFAVSDQAGFTEWLTSPERQGARTEIAKWRKERSSIPFVNTPVFKERQTDLARPSHIFDRGNQTTKTDVVQPTIPGFLANDSGNDNSTKLSRLDMAAWITSPKNPLTARVAVNRFWAQIFGAGIVETQEDFGIAGASPSHPRLLDDLSVRFREDMNWSIKSLLEELVLSSTYRQTSATNAERTKKDPANKWLSRGPRNRLPAETVRDQALAIAGLLSDKQFGPPVHPPLPDGVWKPFQGNDKWATVDKSNPDRYRKTIYTYTKRTIPYPVMASFDAPSREFCSMRRLPSNTPIQALMTLNDATFVEASQALASRMIESEDSITEQLTTGFELAVCRKPTQAELVALKKLFETTLEQHSEDAPDRHSAMTTVASVLLNLDEVLTK